MAGLFISPKIAHNAEAKPEVKVIQLHSKNNIEVQIYAYERIVETWGEEHWESYSLLIKKESGFDNTAQNPDSTAYGVHQFLNSTWKIVGCDKTDDPYVQVDCGIEYIKLVHSNPQVAWQHSIDNNWY